MFLALFANARSHMDLINAVATGLTRFARVAMRTNALTLQEKTSECRRLTGLYRAVVWRRVIDDTDQAGEISVLLCCVTAECGSEWDVARQVKRRYIYS